MWYLVVLVIGLVVGAGVVWYGAKRNWEEKAKDIRDEIMDELKNKKDDLLS